MAVNKPFRYVRMTFLGVTLLGCCGITPALAQVTPSDVSVVGTLSSHSIMQKELLRFTIAMTNKSSSAINSVRLTSAPDSYRFDNVCGISENQKIKCYTGEE